MNDTINVTKEVNMVWSIANKLRGPYKSDKYKDVINLSGGMLLATQKGLDIVKP